MAARTAASPPPPREAKRFYKIGDAARLVGVKPHVLRYWESEFPELRPLKTRGAHRMYGVEHLALARRIRDLVQQQGFTVQGARRRLREEKAARGKDSPTEAASTDRAGDEALGLRRELLALRANLEALLTDLEPSLDAGRKSLRVEAVQPTPRRVPERG